ncbi:MAG TPA: UpxY family transcription antiterminator [Terriglobales bacterium]|nr:UpxY family transcription antiterminator [Terriglobales bacterium]
MSKIGENSRTNAASGENSEALHFAPQWFAAYTTTRHEKAVAEHFAMRSIEAFLPLYKTQRLWRNGCRMNLELPLFPSYVFVRVPVRERVRVLEVPGVLSLVSAAGKPVPLPEADIQALRSSLPLIRCEPHPYLKIGERVRIKCGTLEGMEGILLRKKGLLRVVLSLDLIMKSVAVEVDAEDVEPVVSSFARHKLA